MYNNPNFFQYQSFQPRPSLFNSFKNLNFGEILNSTQKTLNVINQAIPIFHQIRPLWNNARTIFRIANAINEDDKTEARNKNRNYKNATNKKSNTDVINTKKDIKYNEPVFFL